MSDLATTLASSPRQQFKARLKLRVESSGQQGEVDVANGNNSGGGDELWKRKYDLAVKHSLAKHLAAPPGTTTSLHNDADANQILSPSSADEEPTLASASSADDSIIRRVEEEIAAARKAASGVNRLQTPSDTDMARILQLEDTDDRRNPNVSHASSEMVLEQLIQNEFQPRDQQQEDEQDQADPKIPATPQRRDGVEMVYADSPAPISPLGTREEKKSDPDLYFTDEDWQTTTKVTSTTDENLPTTEESEPPSSPENSRTPRNASRDIMMEQTEERNIDGKNTYVFRLVRNPLRPSETEQSKDATGTPRDAVPTAAEITEERQEDNSVPLGESPIITPKSSEQGSAPLSAADESLSTRNKEPEGNYANSADPTLMTALPNPTNQQRFEQSLRRSTLASIPSEQELATNQSLVTAPSKRDMDRLRTQELLGSLKEQRNVMSTTTPTPTRRPAASSTTSSSGGGGGPRRHLDSSGSTPRSPNHFTFSRANRARERVKTASKAGGSGSRSARSSDMTRSSPRRGASPRTRNTPRTHRKPHFPDHTDLPSKRGKPEEDPRVTRRIRFRNPFPVLKPPVSSRSAEIIIQDHETGVPEAPIRWVKPKRELKQLIVAAMGTSLPRRSNACGALKVLTRQKKNQLALVRTDGFLSALIFAASQSLVDTDRELAQVARTRAVNCLKHVSEPKDNRVLIMNHPGVLECLVKVMKSDGGEGRALATASLAMLAKTACCREGLARVDGLVDATAKIMNGAAPFIVEETEPLNDVVDSEEPTRTFTESASDFSQSVSTGQHISKSDENDEQDEEATAISESSASGLEEEDHDDTDADADANTGDQEDDSPPTEISRHEPPPPMTDSIRFKAEERQEEFTSHARANACAVLLHLSKQCAISPQLCTEPEVLRCILSVAREVANPIHTKCLEIISNMTRFPPNNHILTRFDGMIDTLVAASNSTTTENRICALRSLQNMAANPSSKALLATSQVLNLMTACAMRREVSEKEVAVATIYNITTEPSAVTAITNTKNVVATLVHLAHSPDSSSSVRLLACEALATISLWLQTLAGSGKVPEGISNVPLPSQKTTGWERWD